MTSAPRSEHVVTRVIEWLAQGIAVFALVALMLHTIINVVMRKSPTGPLEGTLEYGAYWYMPLIVFLGLVLAQKRREQIEATLLFDRLPAKVQREYHIIGLVVTFAVCIAFTVFGWTEALKAMRIDKAASASDVLIWPTMFLVPLGFALISVQIAFDTVDAIRNWSSTAGDAESSEGASDAVATND